MLDHSNIDQRLPLLDISYSMAEAADPPIYTALVRVKPEGLTLGGWATKAGLARNAFNDIRRHGNPKNETLEKLLDAVGISWAQFDAGRAPVRTEVAGAGVVGAMDVHRAFYGEAPLPDLPVLGTALGGELAPGDDVDPHIEMTELHLGEVLEYLTRPASLAGDKDAYALTIVGDSMAPRFEPGERAAVSPRYPVAIGDDVIVQLRGLEGEDERIKMVLIKRLVRRTATYVELRQFNPDITFRIEASRVAALHKVTGRLF
jgi:hypothetical protein